MEYNIELSEISGKTIGSITMFQNKNISQDNEHCTIISESLVFETAVLHFTDKTAILLRYYPPITLRSNL